MAPEGKVKNYLGELTGKDSTSHKKVALNSPGHLKMCGPGKVGKQTPGGFIIKILWPGHPSPGLESTCTLVAGWCEEAGYRGEMGSGR